LIKHPKETICYNS